MNNHEAQSLDSSKLDELQNQIVGLKQQLDEANMINQAMWSLLVENSKRLQVSLAAIKAAVSSLLDYEIFWDGSTQHELLEIIDNSTDQVSDQITLLSLAFLSESKTLEIRPELNSIPEILSSVLDVLTEEYTDLNLKIELHQESKPALVDYEYLSLALKLLFEVLAETQPISQLICVNTNETDAYWHINILGLNTETISFISSFSHCLVGDFNNWTSIVPINKLKLLVMCEIFAVQSIRIQTVTSKDGLDGIQLSLPLGMSL